MYKDKDQIIASLRKAYPPFKETKEFEFAFKIRCVRSVTACPVPVAVPPCTPPPAQRAAAAAGLLLPPLAVAVRAAFAAAAAAAANVVRCRRRRSESLCSGLRAHGSQLNAPTPPSLVLPYRSDRTNPKEWYLPKNLMEIPPEEDLEKAPLENVKVSAAAAAAAVLPLLLLLLLLLNNTTGWLLAGCWLAWFAHCLVSGRSTAAELSVKGRLVVGELWGM